MVVVKLTKQVLAWTETEFLNMLAKNPDFHARGIKNGKYYRRAGRFEGVNKNHASKEKS